jgi:hypothetical protein
MPPTPTDFLKVRAMTGAVNKVDAPNQFLRRLLYSNTQALSTEDIEIAYFEAGRKTAPFVSRGSEARLLEGVGSRLATVAAPNMRVKMAFTGDPLLFTRYPDTNIYVDQSSAAGQLSAVGRAINRDLAYMESQIVNTEEWMCSQALQQDIIYQVADNDNFRITYPRSSANNITLLSGEAWDNADPTLPRPLANIHTVKRIMSNAEGLQITDAICGINAANAILELAESGNLPAFKTDSGVSAGTLTFTSQFDRDGVVFLGTMGGVRFWEYSRTVSHNGVTTSMIRDDYIEFVSTSAASERVMYYGAIPDIEAIEGRKVVGRRFAKSWVEKDPAARIFLVHTRPLPVNRRPDATVSMKVTNV